MSWKKKPCKNPICKNATTNSLGYCDDCIKSGYKKEHYDNRSTSHQRGYDYRWQAARVDFLRENPLCSFHLKDGQFVPATVVDHIEPHRGEMKKFWDKSNWQSLCATCHNSTKQKIERNA